MNVEELQTRTARIAKLARSLPSGIPIETPAGRITQTDLTAWYRRPARQFTLDTCPGSGVGRRYSWGEYPDKILTVVGGIASVAQPATLADFDLIETCLTELGCTDYAN